MQSIHSGVGDTRGDARYSRGRSESSASSVAAGGGNRRGGRWISERKSFRNHLARTVDLSVVANILINCVVGVQKISSNCTLDLVT